MLMIDPYQDPRMGPCLQTAFLSLRTTRPCAGRLLVTQTSANFAVCRLSVSGKTAVWTRRTRRRPQLLAEARLRPRGRSNAVVAGPPSAAVPRVVHPNLRLRGAVIACGTSKLARIAGLVDAAVVDMQCSGLPADYTLESVRGCCGAGQAGRRRVWGAACGWLVLSASWCLIVFADE